MTSPRPNAKKQSPEEASRADVLARLCEEFHRLNQTHFGGSLALDEILLSTRKQYGGYYLHARKRIVLSWPAHISHGWDETLNTFRHEVAHIVHQNHSAAFWQVAAQVGCTRRHAAPPVARTHAYCRYVYECPGCKAQVFRRKRLIRSSCGKCDRSFNTAYLLRLVSSTTTRARQGE